MSNPMNIVCPACSVTNRIPAERLGEHAKCGKCGSDLFTGHPTELSAENFAKHISRNDIPVLVDFWRLGAALAVRWLRRLHKQRHNSNPRCVLRN
ncbi:hypothetical protein [Thiothrix subterranea]|uniref:hypothetical protein n=1 Tax=Thiothrix subterranea TaxID=2735563 RepID=UPI0040403BA5